MYELKTNTAYRIAVGPLVDPTDGKTAETALTVTGMTVDILQMDNDGTAVNRTSFSPTASGGNNDMIHVSSDAVGMYDLELTAAQLNFLGNARLVFYDVDGFLVHWIDIQVVSAAYFEWKYGTTIPNVNVTQISGDSTAADNCELMFDGTGYAGGTTQLNVNTRLIANGAITAAAIADNAITAAKIATGAITNAKFAAGAIDAAAIAADAIGASELAAGAVTEIVTGVWNAATSSYGGAGTYGQAVEDALADTNELQTDLVNGGRLDLLIDAIKAKTDNLPTDPADQSAVEAAITAAHSTTNGKIDAVDDYVDTEVAAILAAVDTEVAAVKAVTDKLDTAMELDGAVYRYTTNALEQAPGGTPPSAASIADAVWDEALSGHADAGSAGASLSAAGSAGDPWATAIPGAYGAGTAGKILGDNINAPIATVDTVVDAIKAKTDSLTFTVSGDLDVNVQSWKGSAAPDMTGDAYAVVSDAETGCVGIATEVASVGTKVDKIPKSDGSVTWNSTALGSIQSECTDALNAYDSPTKAEMDAAIGGVSVDTSAVADAVWDEATLGHSTAGTFGLIVGAFTSPLGTGAITYVYTLTDGLNPIENAQVWVSTDIAGSNVIASGYTSSLGTVTFYLDAGTYYIWRQKNGYNFTNPDQEVVSL